MAASVRVTPTAELTALADTLGAAAGALHTSLGDADDWTAGGAGAYQVHFGPATQVADEYARLSRMLPEHVEAVANRLAHGEDAVRDAAVRFAQTDVDSAARMPR